MNLWSLLLRARELYPEAEAVVDGALRLNYAELGRRVDRLAAFLAAEGVGPGDRIAVLLPNGLPYIEAYFAAAGLGAVLVPLNARLGSYEIGFILADSGAVWLIADPALAGLARASLEVPREVRGVLWTGSDPAPADLRLRQQAHDALPDSAFTPCPADASLIAHLYYTSGTTGHPKGVILTHGNVATHSLAAVAELQLTDRDRWAHVAPMFHLADAWATFAITWVGGCHVMFPRFDPREILAGFERERVTLTNLVPTMLNLMVKHPDRGQFDYSSLRLILSGGAPIAPSVVAAIIETFGCEYVQTYGMTETSPYLALSILKANLRRLSPQQQLAWRAKTGRPFIAIELRVVDETGRPVPADERSVGEIQVRGPTVTPGYWNRPEATAEAFVDGWLRTGDLAVLDAEGYVTIVDRRKDIIITGGEKVYSTEVETVLYGHPAVLEAAAYGAPDPVWGEVVAAAVVLRPGTRASAEELMAYCRERLGGFKQVRRIRLMSELPRTGSGKILKRGLREPEPSPTA
jgi:fatty-acyl-CoA synthase